MRKEIFDNRPSLLQSIIEEESKALEKSLKLSDVDVSRMRENPPALNIAVQTFDDIKNK